MLQSRAVWLLPSGLFLLLGVAALPHDLALARWFAAGNLPGGFDDLLDRAETFAHGIGIAAILLALFVIDRSRRWTYPRVILAVVAAGMGAKPDQTEHRSQPPPFDRPERLVGRHL